MRKGLLIALILFANPGFASENSPGNVPVTLSASDRLPFFTTLAIAVAFLLAIIFLVRHSNKVARKRIDKRSDDYSSLN